MGLFDAFQLPPEPCTEPIPWLEHEIGRFYAPQLIQCRVCRKYKTADSRLFRPNKTIDVLRTTCRNCELQTQYGRTLNKRAQMIQQDPTLPAAFKQRAILALPDAVRMSKTARLETTHSAAHKYAFKQAWKKVSHMVSVRRQVLDAQLAASRSTNGRLHQLRVNAPICASYISELRHLFKQVAARIRNPQVWGPLVNWHLPPAHWRDAIELVDAHHPPYRISETKEKRISESLSPWEFTTPAERTQLERYDIFRLEEHSQVRQQWVELLSYGKGKLLLRMYPEMPMPGMRPIAEITPDWLRAYNGYAAPEVDTAAEPTAEKKAAQSFKEAYDERAKAAVAAETERRLERERMAKERVDQAEARHAASVAQQAERERRDQEADAAEWDRLMERLPKPTQHSS